MSTTVHAQESPVSAARIGMPRRLHIAAPTASTPTLDLLALIWAGHIGLDRMLGCGLKYPTVFKDTHLGRV